ncbi:uncharacterized protein LOC134741128 [Cydia strobilella]|uniref:uncharacterized protein LOC134741128 n=1 Tax=Cydia strobilella TaxID=1100964 RepID=UPI0030073DCC
MEYSAADHLGSLTELKVTRGKIETGYQVQCELEKMAKLERLELRSANMLFCFPEKVAQLPRLEHLAVSFKLKPWDLKKVLRGCGALRSLELLDCNYKYGFVEVISQHGGALTAVKLDMFVVKGDDVLQLVRGCPKLELLTIGGDTVLTRELQARVAAERAGRGARPPAGRGACPPAGRAPQRGACCSSIAAPLSGTCCIFSVITTKNVSLRTLRILTRSFEWFKGEGEEIEWSEEEGEEDESL